MVIGTYMLDKNIDLHCNVPIDALDFGETQKLEQAHHLEEFDLPKELLAELASSFSTEKKLKGILDPQSIQNQNLRSRVWGKNVTGQQV